MSSQDNLEKGAWDILGQMPEADARQLIEYFKADAVKTAQETLQAEYEEKLRALRGNIIGISRLQAEYMAKGLPLGRQPSAPAVKAPDANKLEALDEEYRERLAKIRNGDLVAISALQTEMMQRGWSVQLVQDYEPVSQDDLDDLREQYEREKARVQRGDLRTISNLQAKYRRLGLDV